MNSGKILELYFFLEEELEIRNRAVPRESFRLTSLSNPLGEEGIGGCLDSLYKVAFAAKRLFLPSRYDRVIFYHSLDENVHGKPNIEATRERTIIRGAINPNDILYDLRGFIDDVIKEESSKEGTQLR